MPFVKVQKNHAYFMRYQTKFRRRRECRTDYYARHRLIIQDKNQYEAKKYRFVVRFTNKDVICQIFHADLTHDVCLAAAASHELSRYGLTVGLTNYAAAYCTGLLLARRVNSKFGLNYEGLGEASGDDFNVEANPEGPKPFRAYLDVGLRRTTTGARLFGALKGACDGGLDIPHNERRFPGSSKDEEGEYAYDPDFHRKLIFGGHVGEYMDKLKEDDEEAYKRQFGRYIQAGIGSDDLEELYKKVHADIRAEPFRKRDPLKLGKFKKRDKPRDENAEHENKYYRRVKISLAQRKGRIRQKLGARGLVNLNAEE